jgi:hypothetical protein
MGTPAAYLPAPIPNQTIYSLLDMLGLPIPVSITAPKTIAQYHSIYCLDYAAGVLPDVSFTSLILRVSGTHITQIKTANEVAVITWLRQNTSIPVPKIVAYDTSNANPIGQEYILMERMSGRSLDLVWDETAMVEDSVRKEKLLDQLLDVVVELHQHPWSHIGGLTLQDMQVIPGPVIEETFWQIPDIAACFPGESFTSLNITGPFSTYIDYISAHFGKYIYCINIHDSLAWMRDLVPRLERFRQGLEKHAEELNNTVIRLAHKDLHFGNILWDTETDSITGIIDWEFANAVPFQRWDPVGSFLATGQYSEKTVRERNDLRVLMDEKCRSRGVRILDDEKFTSKRQEAMQKAQNFLRAIVEVCPRGQREDVRQQWREILEEHLTTFGV